MRSSSVLVLVALAACVDSTSVPCGDGSVCPQGTKCTSVTYPTTVNNGDGTSHMDQKTQPWCASVDELASCANVADGKFCMTAASSHGRCYGGVCLPGGCGNGHIDPPDPDDPMGPAEVCDDGNQAPSDGCSADCKSDETCGNGTTDFVKQEQCDDGNLVNHDGCDSQCRNENATAATSRPPIPGRGMAPTGRTGLAAETSRLRAATAGSGGCRADSA